MFIFFKNNPVSDNDMNVLLFKKIRNKSVRSVVTKKRIDYTNHGATYVVYETVYPLIQDGMKRYKSEIQLLNQRDL